MKAQRIHAFGGPEELLYEDAPKPIAKDGEVLVRIHASAINPADWKMRAGMFGKKFALPLILGNDFSGVVEELGPGTSIWKVGDEVFGYALGAYAEYIAVPEKQLAPKPKKLDHIHSAALASASLTAWRALFDTGGLKADQKVLIHGGTGGVGGYAVQLAHAKGAFVYATASKKNQDYLLKLGADVAIDYESDRFEDVVKDVDLVLDTQGGDTQARSWKTLRRGGLLLSIVQPPSTEEAEAHGVKSAFVLNSMNAEALATIASMADGGKIKVTVDTILPLIDARQGQEMIETGHTRGKIALRVV